MRPNINCERHGMSVPQNLNGDCWWCCMDAYAASRRPDYVTLAATVTDEDRALHRAAVSAGLKRYFAEKRARKLALA